MTSQVPTARRIVQYASQDALAPMTAQILGRLGYELVRAQDLDPERETDPRPDLLLVDERRLVEVPGDDGEAGGSAPIVLLSGRHGATGADPRIIGAVKRPAGLHDLYRLMQQVFEDTPRTTPRIATQLGAHCQLGEQGFTGRVLSLSENGCLIRTSEAVLLGQTLELDLTLPRGESLSLAAEAAYQLLPDTGLVFHDVSPEKREILGRFVADTLMAA